MGGYGPYVWGSFGLTFVVLIVVTLQSRARHKRIEREVHSRLVAMESRE